MQIAPPAGLTSEQQLVALRRRNAELAKENQSLKQGIVSYTAQQKANHEKMQRSISLEKAEKEKALKKLAKREGEFERVKLGVKEFHAEARKRLTKTKKQLAQEVEKRCRAEKKLMAAQTGALDANSGSSHARGCHKGAASCADGCNASR